MIKKLVFFTCLLCSITTYAENGVIHVTSPYSVEDTATRFENILKQKGMTIFNRIKHSDAAHKAGIKLRDTQLIIFGNPKVGTPLMQCQQTIALDLPQKALVWKNDRNEVRISYNEPAYLQQRHQVQGCTDVFAKISKALYALTAAAVQQ